MDKQDLQKEYFVTIREIIRSIHIDVAEATKAGISPMVVLKDIMETVREEADKIMEQSNKYAAASPDDNSDWIEQERRAKRFRHPKMNLPNSDDDIF